MSITITGEFQDPYQAWQAAHRLRRRGYTVSGVSGISGVSGAPSREALLVADPFAAGGYTFGNHLLSGTPPLAGNGVVGRIPESRSVLSVLTDDTQTADARALMESLGGRIL